MKFEFSAGGIVFKKEHDDVLVLIAKHSQHKGWVFPKGLIDREKKERKEDAAAREVKEETGIEGIIEDSLPPIAFWYIFEGEKRKKTVYYFLMRYGGGDLSEHDFEMEEVVWVTLDEALKRLTFKSEKELFESAIPEIKKLAKS